MSDEQAIRDLVATWMAATRDGDVDTVLGLMTDDAVFLTHGRPPMTKSDFAKAAEGQARGKAPKFDGHSEMLEIQVLGDWAFMRTRLSVTATPPDGSPPTRREGHTLTLLRKDNGRWKLARDANLLAPVA
ncbi:ketosteroid isomerase [Pelomonas sp. Root1217]|uniref:YybH family protein n=1 Tax=Pelomonas sp. Root1217 TaxID=1736430 RepID=UPI0007108439|nr:SgcJ/EcaC family oxidoreductase [Pelomonas sp. Root1217]KQV53006.1 ketosteroid isomerase [Pelomonas sp. Root1217]